MSYRIREVTAAHNINLAVMECLTSCILTYLNIIGKDYKRLLLNYWNLNYQFRTLLSSKDVRYLPVNYFYGIDMKIIKGSKAELIEFVRSGNCAIVLCKASKLLYYPQAMLSLESAGFQHSVLVYGYNERSKQLLIADPSPNYIGEASADEFALFSQSANELLFFSLAEAKENFEAPSPQKLISYSAEQNLIYFSRNNEALQDSNQLQHAHPDINKHRSWIQLLNHRAQGEAALDKFAEDLLASVQWTSQARQSWIARNNLTVTSIIKIRRMVWQSFCDAGSMTWEVMKLGQDMVEDIIKLWHSLNFQIVKYTRFFENEALVQSILRKLELIKLAELNFLQWMNRAHHSDATLQS